MWDGGIPYKYVGVTLEVAHFNKGYVKRMFTGGRPARNERARPLANSYLLLPLTTKDMN